MAILKAAPKWLLLSRSCHHPAANQVHHEDVLTRWYRVVKGRGCNRQAHAVWRTQAGRFVCFFLSSTYSLISSNINYRVFSKPTAVVSVLWGIGKVESLVPGYRNRQGMRRLKNQIHTKSYQPNRCGQTAWNKIIWKSWQSWVFTQSQGRGGYGLTGCIIPGEV